MIKLEQIWIIKAWLHNQHSQCDVHLGISNAKACGSQRGARVPERALGAPYALPEENWTSQNEVHERQKLEVLWRSMSFGTSVTDLEL